MLAQMAALAVDGAGHQVRNLDRLGEQLQIARFQVDHQEQVLDQVGHVLDVHVDHPEHLQRVARGHLAVHVQHQGGGAADHREWPAQLVPDDGDQLQIGRSPTPPLPQRGRAVVGPIHGLSPP